MNLVEVYDDANNVNCVGSEMKKYIPSLEDNDLEEFVIYKGKLMYIGSNESRSQAANSLGIESGSETTKDIVKVTDIVNTICSSITPPANDTEETPSGCIGTRLYDKNNQNSINWRLVIEYSNSNQEKARYGSGWFLLKSGTILEDGTEIKNDYVINYETNEMALLSNYKEWTLSSQLAVVDGLALNVDATNLSDGRWTGVTKHGDVVYDAGNRALLFNEDETNNPNGEEGYLEYTKEGLDFSHGFSFEIYANLSRLRYNNGSGEMSLGMFCKMPNLNSEYTLSMRFGCTGYDTICKFNTSSSWFGNSSGLYTVNSGSVMFSGGPGYNINEDFYLTYVYRRYNDTSESERNEMGWTEMADRVEYYINGQSVGYTYYGIDSYDNGGRYWNIDEAPFFVGVCPWYYDGNVYYLKGQVYSCRLYETAMSVNDVKSNYDATVQFRTSGL